MYKLAHDNTSLIKTALDNVDLESEQGFFTDYNYQVEKYFLW